MKFVFVFFFSVSFLFADYWIECYPEKKGNRKCELRGVDGVIRFDVPCKIPEKKIKQKIDKQDFIKKNRERKRRFRK